MHDKMARLYNGVGSDRSVSAVGFSLVCFLHFTRYTPHDSGDTTQFRNAVSPPHTPSTQTAKRGTGLARLGR